MQQALVLAWETLNRICAKRLIPFLPDMIESLEQNGHLQLSEEDRRSWMQADPTRTSGDLLRELQALFPGCYQPLLVRTLQRGMRKIRDHTEFCVKMDGQ